jgi:hypothetical protein
MISWRKILIIGHGGHGKDTFAKLLDDMWDFRYTSTSKMALDLFMWDKLKDKYNYSSPSDCYSDRVNKREEWFEAISDYNKDDETRLVRAVLNNGNCCVGVRDKREFLACKAKKIFDLVIWVDASDRLDKEPVSSFDILKSDADIIIDNNSDINSLIEKAKRVGRLLF